MRISYAIHRDRTLHVTVDGHELYAFETKFTLLQLGYAVYLFDERPPEDWMSRNGETIPADPTDSRSEVRSDGMFITSDPVLFTLAYEHWWAQNGRQIPENVPLPIPLFDEALRIMRAGKIPIQKRFRPTSTRKAQKTHMKADPALERKLSAITSKFDQHARIEPCETVEVRDSVRLDGAFMLKPRLDRAIMNQLDDGEATVSRYAIWAETLRGLLLAAHEDCRVNE